MKKHICLVLLILCSILSQGTGTLSENDTKKVSDHHVRKKRLISRTPNGNKQVRLEEVPYIVSLILNVNHNCGGSILTPEVILTAAHCFDDHTGSYSILSGSPYVNRGTRHTIKRLFIHPQFHPKRYAGDLALIIISPPIDVTYSPNREILLYNGQVPPNTFGIVSGWGSIGVSWNWRWQTLLQFPRELRSMKVPTISEEQCRQNFEGDSEITDKVICTFDRLQGKRCSSGDSGNPLVIEGQLAGIMAWNWEEGGPDVFMNLSHPDYRNWIISKLEHEPSN